jgi:hypothetical protein
MFPNRTSSKLKIISNELGICDLLPMTLENVVHGNSPQKVFTIIDRGWFYDRLFRYFPLKFGLIQQISLSVDAPCVAIDAVATYKLAMDGTKLCLRI